MAYELEDKYLVEINRPSIIEVIDETFDGISSLLTNNAVMYGSTINSIVAGLPISGDLDISVSSLEYSKLTREIASSVKWLQVEGASVPEGGMRWSPGGMAKPKNPYDEGEAKHLPISSVVSFKTVNDAVVQIMQSKTQSGDPLEDALAVVRKVDFTCCSLAVDKWGRMLETIKNGYSDCQQRILRIQDYQPRLNEQRLVQRIRKYTGRGWQLSFSIDQALLNLKRAKVEYAARMAKKKKFKKKKKTKLSCFTITKSPKYGIVLKVSNDIAKAIGSNSRMADVVRHFSDKLIRTNAEMSTIGGGFIFYWPHKTNVTRVMIEKIQRECDEYFHRNYGMSQEKIARCKHSRPTFKYDGGYPGGVTSSSYYYTSTSSSTTS